jgi:hypothetical protein
LLQLRIRPALLTVHPSQKKPIVGGRYMLWRQTLRERRGAFFANLSLKITRESIAIFVTAPWRSP